MRYWMVLMIFVVLLEAFSDVISKEWSLHEKNWLYILALTGYLITNIIWLFALKNGAELARGAVFFSIGSAVLGVIIGLLVYKEVVTPLQLIGVILGLVSSALIFWE